VSPFRQLEPHAIIKRDYHKSIVFSAAAGGGGGGNGGSEEDNSEEKGNKKTSVKKKLASIWGDDDVDNKVKKEDSSPTEGEDDGDDDKKKNGGYFGDKLPSLNTVLFGCGVVLGAAVLLSFITKLKERSRTITMDTFLNTLLPSKNVDHLEYDSKTNLIRVYMKGAVTSDYSYVISLLTLKEFEDKLLQQETALALPPEERLTVNHVNSINLMSVLVNVSWGATSFLFLYYLMKKSNINPMRLMDLGMKVDRRLKIKSKKTFADVAGMDEAKAEITEFVNYLKEPERFKRLGARIPRGAILFGPPGTGKTLLAKAVAGEAKVDFFVMAGSDFIEMYVGVGASRVRDLFKQARKSKSAIIYIDEIDAIGRPRESQGKFGGGNDERESTLNQLLVELDGFTGNDNIIVFASTNVNAEDLDPALLRPGRFDRQIVVDKPDQPGRVAIFNIHMKPLKLAPITNTNNNNNDNNNSSSIVQSKVADISENENVGVNVQRLSDLTPGFTGADIMNVCNEAAIIAARRNQKQVEMSHFEEAIERVIAGIEKKNKPLSAEEKRVIAYHESGHAITAWFLKHCDPLLKLSVIPRGKSLGYAQYVPVERHIRTQEQLMDIICQALGGRAAEIVKFGTLTTGAKDDLQKVTRIAYEAVSRFGMTTSIGAMSFPPPGSDQLAFQKPYGENFAVHIDEEAKNIVDTCFNRTKTLLTEKMDLLEKVAAYLLEHEVMSAKQFEELVGARPEKATLNIQL